jgi:hypothetical protein
VVTTFTPALAFLGIAPEATVGTPVAPTFTIPITKFDPVDKPVFIHDPSLRGSMATDFALIQGVYLTDFDMDAPMYVDSAEFLINNILGDRTTTGAADPYTHANALFNTSPGQPKTHTLTHYTGIPASTGARVYSSACLSDLSFTWDAAAKLCDMKMKGQAWGSTIAGVQPTASPSSVPPLASWRGKIGLGGPATGGTLVAYVASATIDIKRKLEPHYTISNGQNPYVIQRGGLGCTGKMSIIAADETPITKLLAATQEQFQLIISNGITGAGQRQLQFDINQAAYTVAKISQGKTASMYDLEFVAIANSTNAGTSGGLSPLKVTILNGNAGTVY